MKLKKSKQVNTVYEAILSPYTFLFRREAGRLDRWRTVVAFTRNERYRLTRKGGVASLTDAKAVAVNWWIRNRLMALRTFVDHAERCDRPLFGTLLIATFDVLNGDRLADAVSPLALRDCLEDAGLIAIWDDWIVKPGRRAKITWPRGFEFLK